VAQVAISGGKVVAARVEVEGQLKEKDKQLEDIIDLDESSLSLTDIELIVKGGDERKYFENKYFGNLYSNILLVLTHETYEEDEAKSLWNSIVAHMFKLNHTLNRNVGISVATTANALFGPAGLPVAREHPGTGKYH